MLGLQEWSRMVLLVKFGDFSHGEEQPKWELVCPRSALVLHFPRGAHWGGFYVLC